MARRDELRARPGAEIIEAQGKYVIPGLMNANVHLLCDVRLENLSRHTERYEELIAEAAQVALKNGVTTVFDTWGPRRFLMAVRDKINSGQVAGSRIFCAGNIIGFDGPFSDDFFAKAAEVASAALVKRINAIWVENVGRHLMWLSPEQVAREVRAYIERGIDFIKYASNEHGAAAGAFLQFSPRVQRAMVEEARRAGITAQAHTTSGEGLFLAVEAGCDLIQHANITGPMQISGETLELLARRGTGAVVFPLTQRALGWLKQHASDRSWTMWHASDVNARNLIRSGARLLLANDGAVLAPEALADPMYAKSWAGLPEDDGLAPLATGHFAWFRAMEEKGCPPMEMLKAATSNIAAAYGKSKDLGTLEPGKIADLLILDKNPLESSAHYRSIHTILKEGQRVDRERLPLNPILTRPLEPPVEEEARYVPFLTDRSTFPLRPGCMCH